MPAAVSSSWWDTEELNHCVFGHKCIACSLEMDLRDEMITLFQLLFCSPRGLIPPGEYQRRSVMPACCCCLAQIVYFKNSKFVLTPWMSRLHIFCLFYLRLLLLFKTSQMFKTWNIFFFNLPDSRCRSCVWLLAWLDLLCAACNGCCVLHQKRHFAFCAVVHLVGPRAWSRTASISVVAAQQCRCASWKQG